MKRRDPSPSQPTGGQAVVPPGAPSSSEKRLRTLSKIVGALTAVAVAGAGIAAWALASSHARIARYTSANVPVLVTSADVDAGQTITADMVKIVDMPQDLTTSEALASPDDVIGQTAMTRIPANAQVTAYMLSGPANTSSLANSIAQGMMAVTVSTDAQSGLGGLLVQGDLVDVYSFGQSIDGSVEAILVAEGARVMALDTNMTEASKAYTSVTIEVAPDQAVGVRAAQADGSVSLVLKSSIDGR